MSRIVDWPESPSAQEYTKRACFGSAIGTAETAIVEFFAALGDGSWASDIAYLELVRRKELER